MDETDFEILRLQYLAALAAYRTNAARVAERCRCCVQPRAEDLRDEEQSLYDLARVRRDMLDALTVLQHRR